MIGHLYRYAGSHLESTKGPQTTKEIRNHSRVWMRSNQDAGSHQLSSPSSFLNKGLSFLAPSFLKSWGEVRPGLKGPQQQSNSSMRSNLERLIKNWFALLFKLLRVFVSLSNKQTVRLLFFKEWAPFRKFSYPLKFLGFFYKKICQTQEQRDVSLFG